MYNVSYNNNGGYNRYRRAGYTNGTSRWNGNQNFRQQPKKRSGAKAGTDKHGQMYVRGWNVSRREGLRTFLAVPYKKSKQVKSKSGLTWVNVMVKIQRQGSPEHIVSGLYNVETRRVIIRELQMVINPSKNYCGTYIRRKN